MRKIRVGRITPPNDNPIVDYKYRKNYSVALGDGQIIFFSSKKKANAFLSDYNKKLNLILIDLNDIYIQVFQLYRISYFYFDHSKRMQGNSAAKLISEIDTLIHKALLNLGSGTPHYTLSYINGIISSCIKLCGIIEQLHQKRVSYYEIRMAQTINGRLHYVSDRLKMTLEITPP